MKKCLELSPLDLQRFTYDKQKKSLVAEASDFGPAREGWWWLGQLWDDAADVGIAIRSHKTNRIEYFYLSHEEKDNEGDLLALHFKPVKPFGTVSTVTILND